VTCGDSEVLQAEIMADDRKVAKEAGRGSQRWVDLHLLMDGMDHACVGSGGD